MTSLPQVLKNWDWDKLQEKRGADGFGDSFLQSVSQIFRRIGEIPGSGSAGSSGGS